MTKPSNTATFDQVPDQPDVPDVPTFMGNLSKSYSRFYYQANEHGLPHVQGVASAKYQYKGKTRIVDFITQGDYKKPDKGVLYILDRANCRAGWKTLDYPHPGGCQVASKYLAIPYHEETLFYDVGKLLEHGKLSKPPKVHAYVVTESGEKTKVPRSVWCVGFVELKGGGFRLAILQGGISFYDGKWTGSALEFRKVAECKTDLEEFDKPNNANLIKDAKGNTWLLTFTYSWPYSYVTAYSLKFRNGKALLKKQVRCTMGANAGFRWGAGICHFEDGNVGIAASRKKIKTSRKNLLYFYKCVD